MAHNARCYGVAKEERVGSGRVSAVRAEGRSRALQADRAPAPRYNRTSKRRDARYKRSITLCFILQHDTAYFQQAPTVLNH